MSGTRWAEKYVGLPFVDGGRGWAGVDCWGLVRLVFKTEAGVELPSYGEISAREMMTVSRTIAADCQREPWTEVQKPARMDVAVMKGKPLHVGVMVDGESVLHVEEHTCAVLLPVDHQLIRNRILSFRRHNGIQP